MATTIETLKKPNGDQVLPRTRAKAVSMEDGTTVEAAIQDINSTIEIVAKEAKEYTDTKVDKVVFDGHKTITVNDDQSIPAPFSELVGLEVVDRMSGRRLLTATPERFSGEAETLLYMDRVDGEETVAIIEYGTFGGMLDKVSLQISSPAMAGHCPTYFYDKPNHVLAYVFEETHDTMGLGITMTQGWYVADGATFTVEPFDPEQHPFFTTTEDLDANVQNDASDYLYTLFPLAEEITYTVSESNIWLWEVGDISLSAVCPVNVNHVAITGDMGGLYWGLYTAAGMHGLASFRVRDGIVETGINNENIVSNGDKTVSITYPVIKQLDQKYLPVATSDNIGGVKAIAATEDMTEPVGINAEGKLVVNTASAVIQAKEYTDSQRIAWSEESRTVVLSESVKHNGIATDLLGLQAGKTYIVSCDGIEYKCICQHYGEFLTEIFILGNQSLSAIENNGIDTGEPFVITDIIVDDICLFEFETQADYTISISEYNEVINTIDEQYIPNTIPKVETAAVGQTLVVKSVDENGKPTEWEAKNASSLITHPIPDASSAQEGAFLRIVNGEWAAVAMTNAEEVAF